MDEEDKKDLEELEIMILALIGNAQVIDDAEITSVVEVWMEDMGRDKSWMEERIESGISNKRAFDAVAHVLHNFIK